MIAKIDNEITFILVLIRGEDGGEIRYKYHTRDKLSRAKAL